MGNKIIDEIEENSTLKVRVINAIKEAGVETFKQAISHPAAAIIIAGAEGFIEP